MPSLSDKLRSLGVKVGARDLPKTQPSHPYSIEAVLSGYNYSTHCGETYVVEEYFAIGERHGQVCLHIDTPLLAIAKWAGENRIAELPHTAFAFLDTETTGLSGGTGTYAFLIGVGRFETDKFHLAQFFMRDPIEEPALLAGFEEFIAPCQAIVSFNGKSFDVPLLHARFTSHGWRSPLLDMAHIDLLHLARRLWRERIPNRALPNLETHVLGVTRSEEDVPGWLIPSLYFDYLRDGDARTLKSIFYHNTMDVISLAALLNHMAGLLANPIEMGNQYGVDLISLAKLFEHLGDLDKATLLYIRALQHSDTTSGQLPKVSLLEAIQRLATIHKRQNNFPDAVELWKQAVHHQHLSAYEELAKFYEHRMKDYHEAIYWTEAALDLIKASFASQESSIYFTENHWWNDLNHRLERLQRKLSSTHES